MPEPQHITIDEAVESFQPITLEEMDSIKLMNRVDTKYLTDEATLSLVLLDAASAGYRALMADGTMISPYHSVYYDTPELKMFSDHHNKRLTRQKVRTRVYVNSGDAYLEIKRKNNKGRTKKKRTGILPGEMEDFSMDEAAADYLAAHSDYTVGEITPELSTDFRRITLVNPEKTERLTIDTRLEFSNFRNKRRAFLQDAVVIELKQDGRASSRMKGILLDHRVKPVRISKYCIGVTLTEPEVKSGRFKEKVRAIEKTINKKIQVQS
ncbi:MAG: polyphosphate polymerase domain-containing protein [Bacteroidales bacterium]|nr:polyphosphate polymerase domain-containing protein [Bacteroidales bacterium]